MSTHSYTETMRAMEHRIDVDGLATHYVERGTGPPVLLLHGAGGDPGDWFRAVEHLSARYRVVAVHLPGYGRTAGLPDEDPSTTAAFLWKFVDALGLGEPVIVGHSLGGLLALVMALRRPGGAHGLVVSSAGGLGRGLNPVALLEAVTPLGKLVPRLANVSWGPKALLSGIAFVGAHRPWRIPRSWWQAQLETVTSREALETALRTYRLGVGLRGQDTSIVAQLPKVTDPVMIVWGLQDLMVPVWHAVAAHHRLPDSELHILPWAGHLVVNEAEPAFLSLLDTFLDRTHKPDAADEPEDEPEGDSEQVAASSDSTSR
jgi:pimeloyl-ACP methyl ester carboxylesterase